MPHLEPIPRPWLRAALLAGAAYLVIGRISVPTTHVQAWRFAAWIASGVVYAIHIGYENFRLRNPVRVIAWHVAVAVAIGGFGLAIVGMVNSLAATAPFRPIWLLALVLWPLITAGPAFLVALVAGALLARLPQRAGIK
jgi:hypothetical protein